MLAKGPGMSVETRLTLSQEERDLMDEAVETAGFVSVSRYVVDLVRRDRAKQLEFQAFEKTPEYIAFVREKLRRSEQGGIVDKTPEQILKEIKDKARADGLI